MAILKGKSTGEEVFALDLFGKFWNNNIELPDPSLKVHLDELNNRILWLENEICWETCQEVIKYIQRINREAIKTGDKSPIVLNIFSPGGELQAMFALYSVIKSSKVPVHTVNYGACHSAAFIVFLAGVKRAMFPYGTFIAHQGSATLGGTYKTTKASMVQYEKDVEKMQALIIENTSFQLDEISEKYKEHEDFYIDYEVALDKDVINSTFEEIFENK